MRRHAILAASALTLLISLAACSGEQATPTDEAGAKAEGAVMGMRTATISAELFYRERIALPPAAVAVAAIEVADSGNIVAETRVELVDRTIPASVMLDVDQSAQPDGAAVRSY